ncbi:MAG: beta-galactosidase, partial [Candidatus Saccharimonadales bacterium]
MAKPSSSYKNILEKSLYKPIVIYWRKNVFHKFVCVFVVLFFLWLGTIFTIAQWYIHTQDSKPLHLGVSFIPDYAQSLGVDPKANMDALLGIGVRQFRLVSYWSDGEPTKGQYDFSSLDWQFQKAEAKHAKIILTVGLRQPRWPECHIPSWATSEPVSVWQPQLENYMKSLVERYKNSPSLESYQVENEYFLTGFGICTNLDKTRLISEVNLVKSLDPSHPIIITRSDNANGIAVQPPKPDMYSISIYRRVWDAAVTHRYLEYPYPAWYYGFIAGWQKLSDGRDTMIGELQAEAWAPNQKSIT